MYTSRTCELHTERSFHILSSLFYLCISQFIAINFSSPARGYQICSQGRCSHLRQIHSPLPYPFLSCIWAHSRCVVQYSSRSQSVTAAWYIECIPGALNVSNQRFWNLDAVVLVEHHAAPPNCGHNACVICSQFVLHCLRVWVHN